MKNKADSPSPESQTQQQPVQGPRDAADTHPILASQVILNLLSASAATYLIPLRDGGVDVDDVFSVAHPGELMELSEAEAILDTAIKEAWTLLTGSPMPDEEDPLEFLHFTAEESGNA